jgi:hypothetical protein
MKQNLHSSVWKCWVLLTIITLCNYRPSFSQSYGEKTSFFEAGITLGPSNFLGDLGGNMGEGTNGFKDNNFKVTKLTYGLWVSYQPNEWFGVRLALNKGTLEGDDAIIKGKGGAEEARRYRNSNFRSKLNEAFLVAELYPTVFFEYEPTDIFHKLRPYALAGVGVFNFNPQGLDPSSGQWVDLQPLRTEGQGFPEYPGRAPYKLTQINVPWGVGVKYFLSESVNLSLEVIRRVTFTDYIDDVSTQYIDPAAFYSNLPLAQAQLAERMANKSGDPANPATRYQPGMKRGEEKNNDSYYSVGIKLGFRLGTGDRWGNSTRCPVRF